MNHTEGGISDRGGKLSLFRSEIRHYTLVLNMGLVGQPHTKVSSSETLQSAEMNSELIHTLLHLLLPVAAAVFRSRRCHCRLSSCSGNARRAARNLPGDPLAPGWGRGKGRGEGRGRGGGGGGRGGAGGEREREGQRGEREGARGGGRG